MNFRILIVINLFSYFLIKADCSDLSYEDCLYWSGFCVWDEESGICQDVDGGGGDNDINYGPFQFEFLTESDGIRQSTLYNGTLLHYPLEANPPFSSIVLIDAFGDEYGLQSWAQFFASYGFISMTIGNFDRGDRDGDSDWDYADRALGLLDAIETIKQENIRELSPLQNQVNTNSFAVSGYSTSGGGAHTAATMDSTLKAAILLNPAVAFLDSVNCSAETNYYCLIEEHLDHNVPVLIFAGETEYDELVTPDDPIYSNMWALPQYQYVPETTQKTYFESSGEGHGSSVWPVDGVSDYALAWLNYFLLDDQSSCDYLIEVPESTSQFFTTLECAFTITYDVNNDGDINNNDLISVVLSIVNNLQTVNSSDLNFDSNVDIFDLLLLSDYLQNS